MRHKIRGLAVGFVMGAVLAAGLAYAADAHVARHATDPAGTMLAAHATTGSVMTSHSVEPSGSPLGHQGSGSMPSTMTAQHSRRATAQAGTGTPMGARTQHRAMSTGTSSSAPTAGSTTAKGGCTAPVVAPTDPAPVGTTAPPSTPVCGPGTTQQQDGTASAATSTTCAGRTGMHR